MKIEVIEIGIQVIEVLPSEIQVIEVFTPGVQGAPGPQGPPGSQGITEEVSANLTVTNQSILIGIAIIPIQINLKDSTQTTTTSVEVLNAGSEDITMQAFAGNQFFYNGQLDPQFIIRPGSGYTFVPKGAVQYAT